MELYGMQDFDPVRHVLENIPSEENDVAYFEEKVVLPILFLLHILHSL